MNVLFTGGKTQGHIGPNIKIYLEMKKNNKFFYIGNKNSLEENIVKEISDIKFYGLTSYGLSKNIFKNIIAIYFFIINYFKAIKILKKNHINLVIGSGGFITLSVIKAAQTLKIKNVLHEQNFLAGKTNNFLSKKADLIFTSFKNGINHFPKAKVVYTGNPAGSIKDNDLKINTKQKYLQGYLKVLVISGSNGSKVINDLIKNSLDKFKEEKIFITWVTGSKYYLDYKKYESDNVVIYPYTHLMIQLMNEADLIISRAGATTISEIIALNKVSILIPSKNVANNHQEYNADYLYNIHAAIKIKEDDLSKNNLFKMIDKAIVLKSVIKNNLEKIKVNDPAKNIVEQINRLVV